MLEITKTILDLETKIKQVDEKFRLSRMSNIEGSIKKGILPKNINKDEAIYIHTKLHMLHTYKNKVLSNEQISKMHEKVITLLDKHIKNDSLDC